MKCFFSDVMDAYKILKKYYNPDSKLYYYLVKHSENVMRKAVNIAEKVNADKEFVSEASILHDIGIIKTNKPRFFCHGKYPYISHGYLGRKMLEKEGYPKHALVAERHVGVCITKDEIIKNGLPLPHRDMCPITLEEKIIAYADKFYSKRPDERIDYEKSYDEVVSEIEKYGKWKVKIFNEWHEQFSVL